eukprot:COSAG05_NODE_9301_length_633_cov_1.256554_1_plen_106_part_00
MATTDAKVVTCYSSSVSRAAVEVAWLARTFASSAPTSAAARGVPNSASGGSASGSGTLSGLPPTEWRRWRGFLFGIQPKTLQPRSKEQLTKAKTFASAARDFLAH